MTQKNVSAAMQLVEVSKWRDSLESLKVTGMALLSLPSLEDVQASAFQTLTENLLVEAGREDDIEKIDGVTEAGSKVELILQDIIDPHLITAARIEEQLSDKAEQEAIDGAIMTGDIMTSREASMESLTDALEELISFEGSMKAIRESASMEGIKPDHIRPMLVHCLKMVPDICERLGVSVEDMGETQILGDMTEAVERINETVEKAREQIEAKVAEVRSQNDELTGAGESEDFTTALLEKTRADNPSGVSLNEGVTQTAEGGGSVDSSEESPEEEEVPEVPEEEDTTTTEEEVPEEESEEVEEEEVPETPEEEESEEDQ